MLVKLLISILLITAMFLPYRLFTKELKRNNCYKEYLQYVKAIDKLDKCSLRIVFLEKCRNSDLIPKFLNFRIPNNGCFEEQPNVPQQ